MVSSLEPNSSAICLLSSPATHQEFNTLNLSWSEASRSKSASTPTLSNLYEVHGRTECRLHSIEQILAANGFRQELRCALFHRLHAHWNVTVAGDENNGRVNVRFNQLAVEVQPALPRHAHIEHETRGDIGTLCSQNSRGRTEGDRAQPDGLDKALDPLRINGSSSMM